jgi:hypothetical protein
VQLRSPPAARERLRRSSWAIVEAASGIAPLDRRELGLGWGSGIASRFTSVFTGHFSNVASAVDRIWIVLAHRPLSILVGRADRNALPRIKKRSEMSWSAA